MLICNKAQPPGPGTYLCPPPCGVGGGGGGEGDIVFSADPVGVSVLVGVASCLHSVSLMNGWILAKLT